MLPNPWAWRSHSQLALQLRDRLCTKASGGAGRAKASVGECLGNRDGSPASLGQHLDLVADLRIGAHLAQLANWSDHDSLGVASADPLNTYIHPFEAFFYINDDPFDNLADDLFAISCRGRRGDEDAREYPPPGGESPPARLAKGGVASAGETDDTPPPAVGGRPISLPKHVPAFGPRADVQVRRHGSLERHAQLRRPLVLAGAAKADLVQLGVNSSTVYAIKAFPW